MYINKTKDYLLQLTNQQLISQSEHEFIRYQDKWLCVDHLIDLLDGFYNKFIRYKNLENGKTIALNSRILLKKYGRNYKLYLNYLIDKKYLIISKKFVPTKHSNTYELNIKNFDLEKIIYYKNYDSSLHKRLLRYYNDEINFIPKNVRIDEIILRKTINHLLYITIDKEKALEILSRIYPYKNSHKHYRNHYCINTISNSQIYLVPDQYGRIHTNFTVLKKEIRNSCLKIDNEIIYERDVKNSQPFFLLKLMADNPQYFNEILDDLRKYYRLVSHGRFYEEVNELKPQQSRDDIKKWIMMVFFNKNYFHDKDFHSLFPTVYSFIKNYKKTNGYKSLAHQLQNIESDFIFNQVCFNLIQKDIKYFTIHDSICVKYSDKDILDEVFDREFQLYIDEVNIKLFSEDNI